MIPESYAVVTYCHKFDLRPRAEIRKIRINREFWSILNRLANLYPTEDSRNIYNAADRE